jgi:hypothetical protein
MSDTREAREGLEDDVGISLEGKKSTECKFCDFDFLWLGQGRSCYWRQQSYVKYTPCYKVMKVKTSWRPNTAWP